MGIGNSAVRRWMSNRERFADLYNGYLFEGNQIILPEDLEPAESEANILLTDKDGKKQELRRHRDIVMRWKKGALLVMLACENQAKIHYAMPVRNMLYDSMSYAEQIRQLWELHKNEQMSSEEFLSKFRKEDLLFPVITIVFYYGENPWDAGMELYEMFPKELRENRRLLRKYIANYRINLVDAGHLESLENFHTDLQKIFGMLNCRKTKTELMQYMNKNQDYFQNIDEDTFNVIREFLHSDRLWKLETKSKNGKESENMCQAIEELYNDGVTEGYHTGRREQLLEKIRLKLAKGKSPEEIADALEEDVATIRTFIEEIKAQE